MSMKPTFYVMVGAVIPREQFPGVAGSAHRDGGECVGRIVIRLGLVIFCEW